MPNVARRMAVSVAHRLDARILCPEPDLKDFTEEQLAALHIFKHEVLGAAYRLYTQVPRAMADPIIGKFFRLSPGEMEDQDVQG
jgi:hypothetical protein